MKLELHNLLTLSLWEEEYTSLIIRERSLIILTKDKRPKVIKFPSSFKDLRKELKISENNLATSEKIQQDHEDSSQGHMVLEQEEKQSLTQPKNVKLYESPRTTENITVRRLKSKTNISYQVIKPEEPSPTCLKPSRLNLSVEAIEVEEQIINLHSNSSLLSNFNQIPKQDMQNMDSMEAELGQIQGIPDIRDLQTQIDIHIQEYDVPELYDSLISEEELPNTHYDLHKLIMELALINKNDVEKLTNNTIMRMQHAFTNFHLNASLLLTYTTDPHTVSSSTDVVTDRCKQALYSIIWRYREDYKRIAPLLQQQLVVELFYAIKRCWNEKLSDTT